MKALPRWYWIVGFALLAWLLYLLGPMLSPFIIAIVLAYMGDPLVDRLERLKISRTWGVIIVFAIFSLVLTILLVVLVPLLGKQLVRLYELAPQMIDWTQHVALPWVQAKFGLNDNFWRLDQLKGALSDNLGKTTDIASMVLKKVTASGMALVGLVANLLLIPVVSFYLMRDWDLMVAKVRSMLPRDKETTIVELMAECHEVIGAFMRGQLLVMLALGVMYATGLMVIGLELGLLIGVFAGLASIVPYLGVFVGISSALIAGLFQFGLEPYPLMAIAAVFIVGQMLEGMLLTPWLVGDRIGLHPVAVIFAIMAGGQLFGFSGILLALPVAAVIMVLLRHAHDFYKLSSLYGESPVRALEEPQKPV
ncbi:AI-2E family transporter [Pseudomonas sp. EL_65y_Pfl2_R95]|uniref:AI-2E family transporter n=1 Tax=Pseudomonas sp. EL_65y_Pfl2_R95 TaxID=3088698 RepID=UPI0030D70B53